MGSLRTLITGFGPYPGVDWNPSRAVLHEIGHEAEHAGVRLVTAELPVEYVAVKEALCAAIEALDPDALLMLGLRPSGTVVNPERVALNLDDGVKADNRGVLREGQPIDPAGPPAYISDLPLTGYCDLFVRAGVPAEVSNHAGAYICNRAYYLAQHAARATPLRRPSLFVHLPPIGRTGVSKIDGSKLNVTDLIAPIRELAAVLARSVSRA